MNIWQLIVFGTMFGTVSGTASAGRPEKSVTLYCGATVAAAGVAAVTTCLAKGYTVVEIAKCTGIIEGNCIGKHNEFRKLESSLRKRGKGLNRRLKRFFRTPPQPPGMW